jgi:hypothetical protein
MDPQHSLGFASCERDSAATSLESLLAAQSERHQPETLIPRSPTSDLRCCCGQADCVVLKHNSAQLHGLERNVQTAAQMGQVYFQLNLFEILPGSGESIASQSKRSFRAAFWFFMLNVADFLSAGTADPT